MKYRIRTRLCRGIYRWDLLAFVMNSIIGASIFGLPSKIYGLTNSYSIFAFLACAVLSGLIILCFAEMSSRYTETGGAYCYARMAFGSLVGFEVGWLTLLTRMTGFAAVCNLFATYLAHFWPAANADPWRGIIITGVVTLLTFINLRGVRETAIISNLFIVSKLLLFLLFIIVGLFFINTQNYSFASQPKYGSFSMVMMLLVFSFGGFEGAVITAGEVRNPRRNYPFALLTGIGIIAVLYILIQIVCIGTLPDLGHSERPLADAAHRFLGAPGAAIISAGALISMLGSLNAGLLGLTRLPFALAERGDLPRCLTATHARFRTPYVSILLSSAIIFVLALYNSFLSALMIATITRLITYVVTCGALLKLRRQSMDHPAAFVAPCGRGVAVVSIALCLWLLTNTTQHEMGQIVVAVLSGLLLHLAYKLRLRRSVSGDAINSANAEQNMAG